MPTPKPVTAAAKALKDAPIVKLVGQNGYRVTRGYIVVGTSYVVISTRRARRLAASLEREDARTRLDPTKRKKTARAKR